MGSPCGPSSQDRRHHYFRTSTVSEGHGYCVAGLAKVICYLDDILISGTTPQEHLDNLKKVLERLEQYGIRAYKSKCAFMCEAVEYLGHRVDSEGLHTLDNKVTAVL